MKRLVGVAVVGFLLGVAAAIGPHAAADHQNSAHVKGSYPNHGYWWIRHNIAGDIQQTSDRCKPAEADYRNTLNTQLKGSQEGGSSPVADRWPSGIDVKKWEPEAPSCRTTSIWWGTDIHFDFMTPSEWANAGHSPGFGGINYSTRADAAYCNSLGASWPCGYHPSRIHINEDRYAAYPDEYKPRFLLHETGHSMGFQDYCGHVPSVSNDGASCAMGNGYTGLDKRMVRWQIYP